MLSIEAGGQVSDPTCYVGTYANSNGTVKVTGAGSTWTNSNLYIGSSGNGTLSIEAGGQVSNTSDGYLGQTPVLSVQLLLPVPVHNGPMAVISTSVIKAAEA